MLAIIPCYNEERSVPEVIAQLKRGAIRCDSLVIDDGSADGTVAAAASAGARVVPLPVNLGIGAAVQTGYRYAARYGYDVAVQIDGDGQHPCRELAKLVQPILDGKADLVIGSRYLGSRRMQSRVSSMSRVVGSMLLSYWVKFLTGKLITDPTSGFRAASREVIERWANRYPADYPEPVSLVQILREKGRVQEVPVVMATREHGSYSIRKFRTVAYMVKVMWTMLLGRVYRQA